MAHSSRMMSKSSLSSALSREFNPAAGSSRQQHRIRAHGAGDFEPPLRAIGQFAGRIVGPIEKTEAIEPVPRFIERRALGGGIGRQAEKPEHGIAGREHQRVVLRDQQILQHRHSGEQPDVLKRPRDPRLLRNEEVRHALQ